MFKPGTRERATAALVAVTLVLALLCSCDECTDPTPCPVGVVEGYVLGGGLPVATELVLRPADDEWGSEFYACQSDTTGWYSLTLPAGKYLLELDRWFYARGGLTQFALMADTIRVGAPSSRVDVHGGAVRLQVAVPGALETQHLSPRIGFLHGSELGDSQSLDGPDTGLERTYTLDILAVGTYALEMRYSGGGSLWLPSTYDADSAGLYSVGVTAPTEISAELPAPARIRGTVTGSWEQTRRDSPRVSAFTEDSTLVGDGGCDRTTAEYSLQLPVATPVKLSVRIGSLSRWIGGGSFAEAALFHPRPGEEIEAASLVESGILCKVDGPSIFSTPSGSGHLYRNDASLSDATTRFGYGRDLLYIGNLEPGQYKIRFEPDYDQLWCPQWYEGVDSIEHAATVDIPSAGQLIEVRAALHLGGKILGRVMHSGVPAHGYWVGFRQIGGDHESERAVLTKSPDGTFELSGLANGQYLIGVYNSRYRMLYWYPSGYDEGQAVPIRIEAHGTVTDIEWQIPF